MITELFFIIKPIRLFMGVVEKHSKFEKKHSKRDEKHAKLKKFNF
jgi:hypothetical protein